MKSESKNITIVGGGIAGMQIACRLAESGHAISLLEMEESLGGRVAGYASIYPYNSNGAEFTQRLINELALYKVNLQTSTQFQNCEFKGERINVVTNRGVLENQDAVVMAGGFNQFDPTIKEELGYGIFSNVVTALEFEGLLNNGSLSKRFSANGDLKVAFVHCVGSRDRQINCNHCSRICCMVGVKQAVEVKKRFKNSAVYNFYMDLRMYDSEFEELYFEAQSTHKVNFVRGRVSEIAQSIDNKLIVKAEDTLIRKPVEGSFDYVVLLNGYQKSNAESKAPIFYTRSSIVSTSIDETIAFANSTALDVLRYLN